MKTLSTVFTMLLIAVVIGHSTTAGVPQLPTAYASADKTSANFGRLNAHRQQQGVGLSWTVLSTQGVCGFIVERSYDGEYFEEVGQAACENSGRHRYNDVAVYPGYIHYRVTAILEDGTEDVSETVVVRIVSRK
jgi:hypothetical protein